jgi:hypothetical protein
MEASALHEGNPSKNHRISKDRAGRIGRNPKSGVKVEVPQPFQCQNHQHGLLGAADKDVPFSNPRLSFVGKRVLILRCKDQTLVDLPHSASPKKNKSPALGGARWNKLVGG